MKGESLNVSEIKKEKSNKESRSASGDVAFIG